jgi:transposase-like protein
MADLGKKCNDLKQIHGLQMCLIAERFGVSSMAVHRWIKKAKEYGKIEEADEEEE